MSDLEERIERIEKNIDYARFEIQEQRIEALEVKFDTHDNMWHLTPSMYKQHEETFWSWQNSFQLQINKNREFLREFIEYKNKWIADVFLHNIDRYVLTKAQRWHLVAQHIHNKRLLEKLDSGKQSDININSHSRNTNEAIELFKQQIEERVRGATRKELIEKFLKDLKNKDYFWKVINAVNNTINRCRDCPHWEEYQIPCGSRMGKCRNLKSYFFGLSRSQYDYKCKEER